MVAVEADATTVPASAPLGRVARLRHALGQARPRILGWYVLILLAATILSVLIGRSVLRSRVDHRADVDLERAVEEVQRQVSGEVASGSTAGVGGVLTEVVRQNVPSDDEAWFTLVAGRSHVATSGAPYDLRRVPALRERWATLDRTDRGELDTPAGPVRYVAVPVHDGADESATFIAARFVGPARSQVDDAVLVMALVMLSVLFGASALAWGAAGTILAPVRRLTDTARSISERDLSERIPVTGNDEVGELARTFNGMLDRLESAFGMQRRFLNDASHELRTPITVIRGHLELVGSDPEEQAEVRALVLDELDRMSRMVEDLLILARAERPGFLQLESVDVDRLLHEVIAKCTGLGDRQWVLEAAPQATILADRHRLTQAVMNLAHNAVQHTKVGDLVAIGGSISEGHLSLWVSDSGPGVPPGERERIFERFARGRNGRRGTGSGLGLSIVRAIADAHGGSVTVRTAPAGGATFVVRVPTVAQDPTSDAPPSPAPQSAPAPLPVEIHS